MPCLNASSITAILRITSWVMQEALRQNLEGTCTAARTTFWTFETPGCGFRRVKLCFLATYLTERRTLRNKRFIDWRADGYHCSRRYECTNPPSLTALFTFAKCELALGRDRESQSKLLSTMDERAEGHACSRNLFYRCAPHRTLCVRNNACNFMATFTRRRFTITGPELMFVLVHLACRIFLHVHMKTNKLCPRASLKRDTKQ